MIRLGELWVSTGDRVPRTRVILAALGVALVATHIVRGGVAGLLGAVPGVLLIIATTRYLARGEFYRLPWLEVALAHFYAFWGAPTLFEHPFRVRTGEDVILETMAAVAATSLIMYLLFPFGERLGGRLRRFVEATMPVAPGPGMPLWTPVLVVVACLSASGVLTKWVGTEAQFVTVVVGSSYPVLSYIVPRSPKLGLVSAMLIGAAGLMSGMLEAVLVPLLAFALIMLVSHRKAPVRAALVFLAVFVVLQPAKRVYRERAWTSEHVATDLGETIVHWMEAIGDAWTQNSSDKPAAYIAERLNDLGGIADTFTAVPEVMPYEYGASWVYLALVPVPRIIMPNKPAIADRFNNRFNVSFGRQAEDTTSTQTGSFPLIADGYWNFGWAGIVSLAAVLGALIGTLSSAIPLTTWGGLTLAVGLLTQLRPTTFIVGQLASIFPRWIGTAAICWTLMLVTGGFLDRHRRKQALTSGLTSTRGSPT